MRKFVNLRFICVILVALFIIGCATSPISIYRPKESKEVPKKVAVVEIALLPPIQPIFPLIDAGIYNSASKKGIKGFNENSKTFLPEFSLNLKTVITTKTGNLALVGEKLYQSEDYKKLTDTEYSLQPLHKDKEYDLILDKDSLNFINFKDSASPAEDLEDRIKKQSKNLAGLAESLKVDAIVLVFINVETVKVGIFGIGGEKQATASVFFIDNQGKIIIHGRVNSEVLHADASDTAVYLKLLKNANDRIEQFFNEIYL